MQGTILSKSTYTYDVYLDAACESFHFIHEKTVKVSDVRAPDDHDHYVVVDGEIVQVHGLKFLLTNK